MRPSTFLLQGPEQDSYDEMMTWLSSLILLVGGETPWHEFRWESILSQQNLACKIKTHNNSVEECPRPWTTAYRKFSFARIKE
jgi:hypothetical protein